MVKDRDRLATYKPCQDGLDRIIYMKLNTISVSIETLSTLVVVEFSQI